MHNKATQQSFKDNKSRNFFINISVAVLALLLFILSFGTVYKIKLADFDIPSNTSSSIKEITINVKAKHIIETFFLTLDGNYYLDDFVEELEKFSTDNIDSKFKTSSLSISEQKELEKILNKFNFTKMFAVEEIVSEIPISVITSYGLQATCILAMMLMPLLALVFAVLGLFQNKVYKFTYAVAIVFFILGMTNIFLLGDLGQAKLGGAAKAYVIFSAILMLATALHRYIAEKRTFSLRSVVKNLGVSLALLLSITMLLSPAAMRVRVAGNSYSITAKTTYMAPIIMMDIFFDELYEPFDLTDSQIESIVDSSQLSLREKREALSEMLSFGMMFTEDMEVNFIFALYLILALPVLALAAFGVMLALLAKHLVYGVLGDNKSNRHTFKNSNFILKVIALSLVVLAFAIGVVVMVFYNDSVAFALQKTEGLTIRAMFPTIALLNLLLLCGICLFDVLFKNGKTAPFAAANFAAESVATVDNSVIFSNTNTATVNNSAIYNNTTAATASNTDMTDSASAANNTESIMDSKADTDASQNNAKNISSDTQAPSENTPSE